MKRIWVVQLVGPSVTVEVLMRKLVLPIIVLVWMMPGPLATAAEPASAAAPASKGDDEKTKVENFKPDQKSSKGYVAYAGKRLDYDAYAGTLIVHLKDWDDVPQNANKEEKVGPAEASMFYVAYFKSGAPSDHRPVTFLFNGGPVPPPSGCTWVHLDPSAS